MAPPESRGSSSRGSWTPSGSSATHRMVALAKRPAASWLPRGLAAAEPKARMRRARSPSDLRRELPPDAEVRESVVFLLGRLRDGASKEDRLDLLRILGKFRRSIEGGAEARPREGFLLDSFPDPDRDVRWELARLIGEYRISGGFRELLAELAAEQDPIAQFHLAQALARIREGWSPDEEDRAVDGSWAPRRAGSPSPPGRVSSSPTSGRRSSRRWRRTTRRPCSGPSPGSTLEDPSAAWPSISWPDRRTPCRR